MILIVDMNDKRYPLASLEFVQPISYIASKAGETKIAHHSEINLRIVEGYDKIILSGTALKDGEFRRTIKSMVWIKECGKPVLGICAGMQAIGLIFDSALLECTEIGMIKIETVKENPLLSSIFQAYALHTNAILPSDQFDALAQSEKCIHALKHREKDIYGVLFHPEVRNREIIEKFLSI